MFVYAIVTWCLLCCFNELISSTITILEFLEEYHIIIFRSVSLRLFLQLCTLASSARKTDKMLSSLHPLLCISIWTEFLDWLLAAGQSNALFSFHQSLECIMKMFFNWYG